MEAGGVPDAEVVDAEVLSVPSAAIIDEIRGYDATVANAQEGRAYAIYKLCAFLSRQEVGYIITHNGWTSDPIYSVQGAELARYKFKKEGQEPITFLKYLLPFSNTVYALQGDNIAKGGDRHVEKVLKQLPSDDARLQMCKEELMRIGHPVFPTIGAAGQEKFDWASRPWRAAYLELVALCLKELGTAARITRCTQELADAPLGFKSHPGAPLIFPWKPWVGPLNDAIVEQLLRRSLLEGGPPTAAAAGTAGGEGSQMELTGEGGATNSQVGPAATGGTNITAGKASRQGSQQQPSGSQEQPAGKRGAARNTRSTETQQDPDGAQSPPGKAARSEPQQAPEPAGRPPRPVRLAVQAGKLANFTNCQAANTRRVTGKPANSSRASQKTNDDTPFLIFDLVSSEDDEPTKAAKKTKYDELKEIMEAEIKAKEDAAMAEKEDELVKGGPAKAQRLDGFDKRWDEAIFNVKDPCHYLCASVPEVVASLMSTGVAHIRSIQGITDYMVTPDGKALYKEILAFGKGGDAIFQSMVRNALGNFLDHEKVDPKNQEETQFIADIGTKQRLQRLVEDSGILGVLQPLVEDALNCILEEIPGYKKVRVHPPVVLYNKQTKAQQPVKRQTPHHDLPVGHKGLVAILGLATFRLVVSLYSHTTMTEVVRLKKLGYTEAQIAKMLQGISAPELVEVKAGEMLILMGNVIHAGDKGIAGDPSLRVHWYALEGEKGNQTTMVMQYHPDLADRIAFPQHS